MDWIAYAMRMPREALATPASDTRPYGGEEMSAPQGPLRQTGARADANRYLKFVCVEFDSQTCHRSSIAQWIALHRVGIEHLRPLCPSPPLLEQERGLLLCGCDTHGGVRLLAVPVE